MVPQKCQQKSQVKLACRSEGDIVAPHMAVDRFQKKKCCGSSLSKLILMMLVEGLECWFLVASEFY